MTPSVLEFADVSKNYGGLRPLRIAGLIISTGVHAILGLDQAAAEVFIGLATGATLPDAGEVRLFGRPTSAITDSADWLATVDRVGIVSERAVLLDQFTVVQNLVMPFTLEIEPPPDAERAKAEALAQEVGLSQSTWTRPLAELDADAALRVRLGRAVALDPSLVLLEHATARLAREAVAPFGAVVNAIAERRAVAVVALTADDGFAHAVDGSPLTLDPATGRFKERRRRFWER